MESLSPTSVYNRADELFGFIAKDLWSRFVVSTARVLVMSFLQGIRGTHRTFEKLLFQTLPENQQLGQEALPFIFQAGLPNSHKGSFVQRCRSTLDIEDKYIPEWKKIYEIF